MESLDRTEIRKRLLEIRAAAAKDQQTIKDNEAEIQRLRGFISDLKVKLLAIRKQVLIESAEAAGQAFRDHVVAELKDLRQHFMRMDRSHKKQFQILGAGGGEDVKGDDALPSGEPNRYPSIDNVSGGAGELKDDEGSPLTKTGMYTAAARAYETKRGGKCILKDAFAEQFAGNYGKRFMQGFARDLKVTEEYLATFVAFRTRFLDDKIEEILKGNADIKQVVILGAGGDSRAYRLPGLSGGGVTVFNVDKAEVVAKREEVFGKATPVRGVTVKEVACDLRRDNWVKALQGAGFDKARKSVFVLEGVLPYMTQFSVEPFLTTLGKQASARGSFVVGDVPNETNVALKALHDVWEKYAQRVSFGSDVPEKLFMQYGFKAVQVEMLGVGPTNYNERAPPAFLAHMKSATRQKGDKIARIYTFVFQKA